MNTRKPNSKKIYSWEIKDYKQKIDYSFFLANAIDNGIFAH